MRLTDDFYGPQSLSTSVIQSGRSRGLKSPSKSKGKEREIYRPESPLQSAGNSSDHQTFAISEVFYPFDTFVTHHIYWDIVIQDDPENAAELTGSEMIQSSSYRVDAVGFAKGGGKRKHDGSVHDQVCLIIMFTASNSLIISLHRGAVKRKNPDWGHFDAMSAGSTSRLWNKHPLISKTTQTTDCIPSLSVKSFTQIPSTRKLSTTTAYQTLCFNATACPATTSKPKRVYSST
jgi:hypothetical protein